MQHVVAPGASAREKSHLLNFTEAIVKFFAAPYIDGIRQMEERCLSVQTQLQVKR